MKSVKTVEYELSLLTDEKDFKRWSKGIYYAHSPRSYPVLAFATFTADEETQSNYLYPQDVEKMAKEFNRVKGMG